MAPRDEVLDILDELRGLLGEGTPVTAPPPSTLPADIAARLDALPGGLGAAIERWVQVRAGQADVGAALALLDPSLAPLVTQSGDKVVAGREALDAVATRYVGHREALAPFEGSPMGQVAVLQSKADAVAGGAAAVRAQLPAAQLRQAMVDELAQRYYAQAVAARSATAGGMPPGGAAGSGSGGASGGSGGGAAPVRPLSSLGSAPLSGWVGAGSGAGTAVEAPAMATGAPRTVAGELPRGVGSERGLQADTILVKRAVSAAFPEITDIGGWRPDAMRWHPNGQAIDVMIPAYDTAAGRALGDRVLAFVLSHGRRFALDHVIWRQRLYTGAGSRPMSDRGDDNQNHLNHLHIATRGGGLPSGDESYVL